MSALQEAAGRPALLLADGLDKWMDLGNILAALQDGEILAKIQCPAVFTGPVNLERIQQNPDLDSQAHVAAVARRFQETEAAFVQQGKGFSIQVASDGRVTVGGLQGGPGGLA